MFAKIAPLVMLLGIASTASAKSLSPRRGIPQEKASEFSREGLLGLGFHLQAGLGVLRVLGVEEPRQQLHSRIALRVDRADYGIRVLFRLQRHSEGVSAIPNANLNVGHAELSVSPTIVFQRVLNSKVALEGGAGLSLGNFVRYQPRPLSFEESRQEFGIPITGELSGALVWQWRKAMSIELGADYRPLIFTNGQLEHVLSSSLTVSVDL